MQKRRLPGGNGSLLKDSIDRLGELDVKVILPGHGTATTVGAERRGNLFLEGLGR